MPIRAARLIELGGGGGGGGGSWHSSPRRRGKTLAALRKIATAAEENARLALSAVAAYPSPSCLSPLTTKRLAPSLIQPSPPGSGVPHAPGQSLLMGTTSVSWRARAQGTVFLLFPALALANDDDDDDDDGGGDDDDDDYGYNQQSFGAFRGLVLKADRLSGLRSPSSTCVRRLSGRRSLELHLALLRLVALSSQGDGKRVRGFWRLSAAFRAALCPRIIPRVRVHPYGGAPAKERQTYRPSSARPRVSSGNFSRAATQLAYGVRVILSSAPHRPDFVYSASSSESVRERERERDRQTENKRQREALGRTERLRERKRVVCQRRCACACVCERERERERERRAANLPQILAYARRKTRVQEFSGSSTFEEESQSSNGE
jgi:hypothetical protein